MPKRFAYLIVALATIAAAAGGAWAQTTVETQCTQLTCARCETLCTAYCNADAAGKRARAYRSCANGCRVELCVQCMPAQYDAKGRKFVAGRTELCRSPGHWENGKTP